MTSTRSRDCDEAEAEFGDSLVTLCVHAGIAAADVLCCKGLGYLVQGDDHMQAVAELAKVPPDGRQRSKDLRVLLQMKAAAAYAAPPVSADQRKRAWRRAENLVEAARSR